jgi:hypothetical protein
MGSVGKTALAVVLAHRFKDRYPDAQLCLNLRGTDPAHRPPVTPVEAMQNIIHVFRPEARLPDSLDELAPIYNSVLNDAGRVLLLLDNAVDANKSARCCRRPTACCSSPRARIFNCPAWPRATLIASRPPSRRSFCSN